MLDGVAELIAAGDHFTFTTGRRGRRPGADRVPLLPVPATASWPPCSTAPTSASGSTATLPRAGGEVAHGAASVPRLRRASPPSSPSSSPSREGRRARLGALDDRGGRARRCAARAARTSTPRHRLQLAAVVQLLDDRGLADAAHFWGSTVTKPRRPLRSPRARLDAPPRPDAHGQTAVMHLLSPESTTSPCSPRTSTASSTSTPRCSTSTSSSRRRPPPSVTPSSAPGRPRGCTRPSSPAASTARDADAVDRGHLDHLALTARAPGVFARSGSASWRGSPRRGGRRPRCVPQPVVRRSRRSAGRAGGDRRRAAAGHPRPATARACRALSVPPSSGRRSEQAGHRSPVDRQVDAGDEAGVLRAEEGHDLTEVAGVAHEPGRDALASAARSPP